MTLVDETSISALLDEMRVLAPIENLVKCKWWGFVRQLSHPPLSVQVDSLVSGVYLPHGPGFLMSNEAHFDIISSGGDRSHGICWEWKMLTEVTSRMGMRSLVIGLLVELIYLSFGKTNFRPRLQFRDRRDCAVKKFSCHEVRNFLQVKPLFYCCGQLIEFFRHAHRS